MDSSLISPASSSPTSLPELAKALAEQLGPAWSAAPGLHDGIVSVVSDDDQRLNLSLLGSRKARLQIRGVFPGDYRTRPHGLEDFVSNLAVDRGAASIARHLRRQLLPRYTAALARVRTYQTAMAAEDARRHQLAGRFRAIWPGAYAGHSRWGGDRVTVLNWRGPDQLFATATMKRAADDVDLELRQVPRELAVQIGCLLAGSRSRATTSIRDVAAERRAG